MIGLVNIILCFLFIFLIYYFSLNFFKIFLILFFLLSSHYYIVLLNDNFDPIKSPEWPSARNINFSNELTKTIKYLENEVWGIESFAIHKETKLIYGSSKDGFILEIRLDSNFRPEIIGRYTYGIEKLLKRRRPLGVRFSRQNINELYFVDAYQGIFMFDTINKKFLTIYANDSMPYLNDFDFLQNGNLVLSQPSKTHEDEYFHRIVLENKPDGQLLHFDMKKKEFYVLIDELYTPNGVQVSNDGNTVFFSEMMAYQIKKFDASKKPIKMETIIDRLSGMPDNIRFDRDGETLIIPLAEERMDFGILNYPFIKHYMLLIYEKFIWNQKPNYGTFASILFLNSSNGKILKAWNDPTGASVGGITQVLPYNDKIFIFGTDMAPALFLLKL